MRRITQILLLVVVVAAGCTGTPPTDAPPLSVDQEHRGSHGSSAVARRNCDGSAGRALDAAQTFVAGATGSLERVSVALFTRSGEPIPLQVTIHPTTAIGHPTDSVIGRGVYQGPALGNYEDYPPIDELVDIDLDEPASLVAGTMYAVQFQMDSEPCMQYPTPEWVFAASRGFSDGYAPGQSWARVRTASGSNWYPGNTTGPALYEDLHFQTWVRPTP